jgi:K+-dependent Na+/Ca+ exchanger-like protein
MILLLSVLLLLLAFYLLAVITEDYFVPAIDRIARKLAISSDASGALLLAAGSSAPEFFTALFAIIGLAGAVPDIGAGAIVGSGIFNVLVIVGVASMFRTIKLQWQPALRDQLFYFVSIMLLLWAFWDGQVTLLEASVFVSVYFLYVLAVIKWHGIFKYEDIPPPQEPPRKRGGITDYTRQVLGIIIPDPHKTGKLYIATFTISILAIAGLSWVLIEQVLLIAGTLNVNPTFLALTVLAAGTSVPDLVGSVVVAKQGRGDMAVSNALGSNIFNILFGLGMPFLVAIIVLQEPMQISQENLLASTMLLLLTVASTIIVFLLRRWRIGFRSGLLLIGMYLGYCTYIVLKMI